MDPALYKDNADQRTQVVLPVPVEKGVYLNRTGNTGFVA